MENEKVLLSWDVRLNRASMVLSALKVYLFLVIFLGIIGLIFGAINLLVSKITILTSILTVFLTVMLYLTVLLGASFVVFVAIIFYSARSVYHFKITEAGLYCIDVDKTKERDIFLRWKDIKSFGLYPIFGIGDLFPFYGPFAKFAEKITGTGARNQKTIVGNMINIATKLPSDNSMWKNKLCRLRTTKENHAEVLRVLKERTDVKNEMQK